MYPWSVVATAGMPCRAASANRSSIRAAPSSMEYSVCTCRWANEPSGMTGILGVGTDNPMVPGRRSSPDGVSPGVSAGQSLEGQLEVGRVLAGVLDRLVRGGVREAQADGVQPLPVQPEPLRQ